MRYLMTQVISGMLLLVGVILYYQHQSSLMFTEIGLDSVASWFIFIAFGIKCAFPFFHNWLTDAYPEATPTGTVFLSAFTTKVAVYAMARGFPGTEMLVYIGATMACFPIFFAVIENDLRRVLAYSLINQIGFMMVGIGIGTELGINGAVAHAFNDVIFKGLLFMSMGAVLYRTGRINGSELGGLYKSMPKTAVLCIIGAASISAFPLFSGFVSKSMIMSAALKDNFDVVWLLLLFASAGVFHHAGIKIPYFAFFAHDSGIRCKEAPWNMLLAMSIAAALCLTIGIFPELLYQHLPFATDYSAYDVSHILTQTQLLFFSALAFVWLNLKGLYPPELPSTNLDVDWLYRRPLPRLIKACGSIVRQTDEALRRRIAVMGHTFEQRLATLHSGDGIFSRAISISSMVALVVSLLAVLLIFRFF
jgi:multicomponent Na+:H+ antiporter subunit D